jgi:hypothetical protein
MSLIRFSVFALILIALPLQADPPKLNPAGTLDAKLGELGERTVTIKVVENELSKSRRPVLVGKEVDHEYDLAPGAHIRRQELPKSKDGKGKSYSKEEYAKLREPLDAPGYKADPSELKPGQIVRLFFAKATPRDRPVVTAVMLIREAPELPKKSDEKKKPDEKKK